MTGFAAIPTRYRGVCFRSRLEARWAAFFDLVSWRWEYEPVDLAGWVPDFVLHGASRQFFVEVKPICDPAEPLVKVTQAKIEAAYHGPNEILLLGAMLFEPCPAWGASIGFLAEYYPFDPHFCSCPEPSDRCSCDSYWWQHAVAVCGGHDFRAEYGSYGYRISGGGNGGHPDDTEREDVEALWREAGNIVQWRPGR